MSGPCADDEQQDPVAVPHTGLSVDALRGVIESFVLREGTDYGAKEYSLEEKVAHVARQLERGEAQIMFDPNTETIDIVVRKGVARQGSSEIPIYPGVARIQTRERQDKSKPQS